MCAKQNTDRNRCRLSSIEFRYNNTTHAAQHKQSITQTQPGCSYICVSFAPRRPHSLLYRAHAATERCPYGEERNNKHVLCLIIMTQEITRLIHPSGVCWIMAVTISLHTWAGLWLIQERTLWTDFLSAVGIPQEPQDSGLCVPFKLKSRGDVNEHLKKTPHPVILLLENCLFYNRNLFYTCLI